jgi:hypothetical protein
MIINPTGLDDPSYEAIINVLRQEENNKWK